MAIGKTLITHVLALAVGAAGMWGVPQLVDNWKAREPVQVVQAYLQAQSGGRATEALRYLTGEAKQIAGQSRTTQPDPIQQTRVELATRHGDLAQVRVHWVAGRDAQTGDFYLARLDGDWKIFSMMLATPDWSRLDRADLKPEHRRVIEEYTRAIAQGDVRKALGYLVGPARIRASHMVLPLVKQDIRIAGMVPAGALPNGQLLVLAKTTQEPHKVSQTLLYTLSEVGGTWKIFDVRLVERHAQ